MTSKEKRLINQINNNQKFTPIAGTPQEGIFLPNLSGDGSHLTSLPDSINVDHISQKTASHGVVLGSQLYNLTHGIHLTSYSQFSSHFYTGRLFSSPGVTDFSLGTTIEFSLTGLDSGEYIFDYTRILFQATDSNDPQVNYAIRPQLIENEQWDLGLSPPGDTFRNLYLSDKVFTNHIGEYTSGHHIVLDNDLDTYNINMPVTGGGTSYSINMTNGTNTAQLYRYTDGTFIFSDSVGTSGTLKTNHISEFTSAHNVVFDNDVTITNLTASSLVATDANKELCNTIPSTVDFTTIHSTTIKADHIGEHTTSHNVVFDNNIIAPNTPRIIYVDLTPVSSNPPEEDPVLTEYDLISYNIPANTFSKNGDMIEFNGGWIGGAEESLWKIYFDGTDVASVSWGDGEQPFKVNAIRLTSSTARVNVIAGNSYIYETPKNVLFSIVVSDIDFTQAINFKTTATTIVSILTQDCLHVTYYPAP